MTWNELIYGLGDLIWETFVVLEVLQNIPNILFTLVLFVAFIYWLMQLVKFKKRAQETGEIE